MKALHKLIQRIHHVLCQSENEFKTACSKYLHPPFDSLNSFQALLQFSGRQMHQHCPRLNSKPPNPS